MTLLIAVHFSVSLLAPLLLRRLRGRAFFLLALPPLAAFVWTLAQSPAVLAGQVLTDSFAWIPVLGIEISFRIGVLQWVLALVVSGIGALVLFYCRWYFNDDDPPTRTGAVLLAFAGAMMGLVTSDDLIGLYVFWELTTVFSYLLVGHNPTFTANRRAALTALIVTTFGGLAMLVGIVLLAVRYDNYSLSGVMAGAAASGVDSPLVVVAVLLLLVGALSKSALVPFHFWLPGAMAAPTPVSAYLHAAAMVKAGVYLVAVLAPVFAGTPAWRPVLLSLGAATMLVGGWRALRQYDIKLLLAYGTVSQLGFLTVLMGIGTRAAALGGLALLISHALFKASLFLVVGIVDHSAGTRDLRKLAGVGRAMPVVAAAAAVAGASMAAVPPTLGFIAKEAGFEALTYLVADGDGTGWPVLPAVLLTAAIVAGSALTDGLHAAVLVGGVHHRREVHLRRPGGGGGERPALPSGALGLRRGSGPAGGAQPGRGLRRTLADRGLQRLRRPVRRRQGEPRPRAVARVQRPAAALGAGAGRRGAAVLAAAPDRQGAVDLPERCWRPRRPTSGPCARWTGSPSRSPP